MQTKTAETKVQDTCDTLIAWGFRCNKKAEFLIKRLDSPEYAIMCAAHKAGFERQYPADKVEFHDWTLELNQQFADEANAFWANESRS